MKSNKHYSRRSLITQTVASLPALGLMSLGWSSRSNGQAPRDETLDPAKALAAAASSDLIYVAGLAGDGKLSRCQAEVWFVPHAGALCVVTAADSWRARAAGLGGVAKVWVGDVGQWQQADAAYQQLPALIAQASVEADSASHEQALALFGKKYPGSWASWGPRFKKGLADGSRVLIRYQPVPDVTKKI